MMLKRYGDWDDLDVLLVIQWASHYVFHRHKRLILSNT